VASGKTARILFLYEPGGKTARWDKEYAKRVLKITDKESIRSVSSWKELSKVISEYSTIDRLVLSFHGGPGALIIGSDYWELNSPAIKELFTRKGNPRKVPRGKKKTRVKPARPVTKVQAIDIEGCNVAQKPHYMVEFAKMFSAKTVAGWTYFRVIQSISLTVTKGQDTSTIEKLLRPYQKYLLPGNPTSAEMVGAARNKDRAFELLCLWFQEVYSDDPLPSIPNEREFRPSTGEGVERTIDSVQAESIAEEFDGPVIFFYHITVNINA
jgi:hypothetical protein